jgi:diamine N-acetyltransferase
MTISLREITKDNFKECIGLKVRDDQRFVAPNVYSIAQAKIDPAWIIKSIYADETMVGFMMYQFSYSEQELYLCRFMIDNRYQHMGYGRASLELLRSIALQDERIMRIGLSTSPANAYGIRVYTRFGFQDTGKLDHGEEVFALELRRAPARE